MSVRDHIPLKQGLRLCAYSEYIHLFPVVRDHLPLKQGLRPIELITQSLDEGRSETIFHYNKD